MDATTQLMSRRSNSPEQEPCSESWFLQRLWVENRVAPVTSPVVGRSSSLVGRAVKLPGLTFVLEVWSTHGLPPTSLYALSDFVHSIRCVASDD
jgi:hypothetical protein